MRSLKAAIQFNVVVLSMIVASFLILFPFSAPFATLWLLSVTFLLYYFLRKHLCTNCVFYGKPCFTGWGLLASKLFPQGSGNFKLGRSVAPLAWLWLFLPPLVALVLNGEAMGTLIWILAFANIFIQFYNFHKGCPMKERCAKGK